MVAKVWEDIKKGVEESITYASEKTKELTAISKLKMAIAGIKRKIDGKYKELGTYVYGKLEEGKVAELEKDETVKELTGAVKGLQEEVKAKEKELEEVGKKEEKEEKVEEVVIADEDVIES